jgi:hypothetical protein
MATGGGRLGRGRRRGEAERFLDRSKKFGRARRKAPRECGILGRHQPAIAQRPNDGGAVPAQERAGWLRQVWHLGGQDGFELGRRWRQR